MYACPLGNSLRKNNESRCGPSGRTSYPPDLRCRLLRDGEGRDTGCRNGFHLANCGNAELIWH